MFKLQNLSLATGLLLSTACSHPKAPQSPSTQQILSTVKAQAQTAISQTPTNSTQEQIQEQPQEQTQEQPQDHFMNCIKAYDDAGFSIYNFARFVNAKYAHFQGATEQEAEEVRSHFLQTPNSGYFYLTRDQITNEEQLRDFMQVAFSQGCLTAIVNADEEFYDVNVFCGDDVDKFQ